MPTDEETLEALWAIIEAVAAIRDDPDTWLERCPFPVCHTPLGGFCDQPHLPDCPVTKASALRAAQLERTHKIG